MTNQTASAKTEARKTASHAKKAVEAAAHETGERAGRHAEDAREMMQQAADVARNRADGAYEAVEDFNKGVETTLTRAVRGYVSILNGVAEVSHENVRHMLATVQKASAAKSLPEAAQIQADYMRESAKQNFEHVRSAYETARDAVAEETEGLRSRATGIRKGEKKAA